MRGRKPTPTALKVVTGNPGHRPLPESEPEYSTKTPHMPVWLRSKAAKEEWEKKTKLLSEAGVLTEADGDTLGMYCYVVAEIGRLTKAMAGKDADIITTGKGDIRSDPRTIRLENYIKELRSYSALFGLDPANRGKIKTAKKPERKKDSIFD